MTKSLQVFVCRRSRIRTFADALNFCRNGGRRLASHVVLRVRKRKCSLAAKKKKNDGCIKLQNLV